VVAGDRGEGDARRDPRGLLWTDELKTPDAIGRFNVFQGGSVYWSPASGSHEVHGAIRDKWASMRWETSPFGYPVTDETKTPDAVGRFNHFENGSVYWTPATGAHSLYGAVRDKWAALGWETGLLRYLATDEMKTPDTLGRFVQFQGGSVYWTSTSGAHEVHGPIRDKWAAQGWERGALG